ncbi:hypothetical protein ODZ84_00950 [Chryseobacterium fluminis]|uniref:hypothetical protein n=1 Tax=Chryseobacterium fluminis TaxID=2983606 RepID=UPI0022550098|nr:hypothetical protein [Chryseobacterium sp. MMS21-Ot14]UZT98170.1 hypothetical protein ODZ84_00950 [Chryseobacterium sp. MMS21-Ot14]
MYSQEKSLTYNSFFEIQAGLFGLDIYNESGLSEQFVLRSEVDLTAGMWRGDLYSETGFALILALSVAHYNINQRNNKSKSNLYTDHDKYDSKNPAASAMPPGHKINVNMKSIKLRSV